MQNLIRTHAPVSAIRAHASPDVDELWKIVINILANIIRPPDVHVAYVSSRAALVFDAVLFSKRHRITLRLLYAIGRPSVVCLSVVCLSVCL